MFAIEFNVFSLGLAHFVSCITESCEYINVPLCLYVCVRVCMCVCVCVCVCVFVFVFIFVHALTTQGDNKTGSQDPAIMNSKGYATPNTNPMFMGWDKLEAISFYW